MELSKRLYAVASLVTEGASVADIGTDHGYIPIWLAQKKICKRIIAMDINQGPLDRAKEHISKYKLEKVIETRLSDGLKALRKNEVNSVVMAGMGGGLVIKILEEGQSITQSLKELILQPQSEMKRVRMYLEEKEFCITEEDMVKEDGKYYPILKVVHGKSKPYSEAEYIYGRQLLSNKNTVLKEYLEKEKVLKEKIKMSLERERKDSLKERIEEIESEIQMIQRMTAKWEKGR